MRFGHKGNVSEVYECRTGKNEFLYFLAVGGGGGGDKCIPLKMLCGLTVCVLTLLWSSRGCGGSVCRGVGRGASKSPSKQSTSWVSINRGHSVNEFDVTAGLCALC